MTTAILLTPSASLSNQEGGAGLMSVPKVVGHNFSVAACGVNNHGYDRGLVDLKCCNQYSGNFVGT